MSFDTSDTARKKILDSVKIHSTIGDDTVDREYNKLQRERFIENLFIELNKVRDLDDHGFHLFFLQPKQLKKGLYQEGVSHGRQLFSDIANAVCSDRATDFRCVEDMRSTDPEEEYGRYAYSWNYGDFYIFIKSEKGRQLDFWVEVSDVRTLSDDETDIEGFRNNAGTEGVRNNAYDTSDDDTDIEGVNSFDSDSDIGSLYTIIRNLHSRLSILESRYSSQG